MRTYNIGAHYEFLVNYYYTTIDEDGRERSWLSLSDGESARRFNVPAYPFQKKGMDGKTIFCKVTNVLDNGYLFLYQLKSDILHECYKEGEDYWFSVGEKTIDENSKTRRPYYRLYDRVNGIDWHRYYCSEETVLDGVVCFRVKAINDEYIDLELADSSSTSIAPQEAVELEYGTNPFGHEDTHHEWKSSLVFSADSYDKENPDGEKQLQVIMRCIAGFQNAEGGLLYIGVTDRGEICGIEQDYPYLNSDEDTFTYKWNTDSYENKIRNAVDRHLGKMSLANIQVEFYYQTTTKKVFCIVVVNKTPRPVYRDERDVYKRFGNSFRLLRGEEITDLVEEKLGDTTEQVSFTRPMPSGCAVFNPNKDAELIPAEIEKSTVKLNADFLKKIDYYYMTFFSDNSFMYSKESHGSDPNCISEVRFNKIDGNMEYSRDLLLKCTRDGHAQFLQAYDVCKLGAADSKISIRTPDIFLVTVVHKYDFLKVKFYNEKEEREKYIRVISLFGRDTEGTLKANKEISQIKYQFKLKGNLLIPSGYNLRSVEVVHETLPDEIQFVSPRGGQGLGAAVGSGVIDTATY